MSSRFLPCLLILDTTVSASSAAPQHSAHKAATLNQVTSTLIVYVPLQARNTENNIRLQSLLLHDKSYKLFRAKLWNNMHNAVHRNMHFHSAVNKNRFGKLGR